MLGPVCSIFIAFLVRVKPASIVVLTSLLAGMGWHGFVGRINFTEVYPFTPTFPLFFSRTVGNAVAKAFIFLRFCSVFQPVGSP